MPSQIEKECEREVYRCIVWGGYAWGNIGDELTLAVALRDLQRRYGDSVAILTRSPGYTRRLFPDVAVIPYEPIPRSIGQGEPPSYYDIQIQLHFSAWAKKLAACEMLYLVGGGYLSELFHLDWLLLPVFVARYCGAAVSTAPIGLGPFHSDGWAKRVADALRQANLLVRDDASAEYCRVHGLSAEQRRDDGFRVLEALQPLTPDRPNCPGPCRIGVNVFNQYGSTRHSESCAWWEALLKQLSHDGTIIEGFCFHNDIFADFAVTTECVARAGLDPSIVRPPDLDFRTGCARLAAFDVILSSRFHAIVVGNTLGKQTYAVCDGDYYRHKMEAATKQVNRSTLVRQFETAPQQAAEAILHTSSTTLRKVAAA